MTSQQSQNAYPLVYEMKIVDPAEFPEIVRTNRSLLDTDHDVAVVDNLSMYTVTNLVDISSSPGRLTKLQLQDFHEHYFTAQDIDLSSGAMQYSHYVSSGTTYPPKTKVQYLDGYIYVMSLSASGDESDFRMEQFSAAGPYDLSLNWRAEGLSNHLRYYQPERYDNHDLFGFISPSGEGRVWAYYYDYSLGTVSDRHIMLHRFDTATGVLDNSIAIEGVPTGVTGIIVDKPSADYDELAVTVHTPTGIRLSHVDIGDGINVLLGSTITITSDAATMPITKSYRSDDNVNTFMTYVDTGSDLNRISFADAITTGTGAFSLPYRYSIDKTSRFSEAYDPDQVNYSFSVASNPLNPNFFYIGYITSGGQIRVIKLYRYLPSGQANYEYILMWATTATGSLSAFTDPSGDFTVETTISHNSLSMVTDKCGNLYVFCRKDDGGYLRMWKIREYLLDLGQDALGITVNSDPMVFPEFLSEVTDNYTILSQESSAYFGSFPSVNDVIVSNITNSSGNYYITFKYIDYNIFQSLNTLDTGLTIAETFNADLLGVLEEIYGSSNNISVINFNSPTQTLFDGTDKTVIAVVPATNLVKPCIARGTQIVAYRNGKPYVTTVENIKSGDFVVNQDAKPVKVVHHTCDIISTNEWTAPYIIPPNFFGQGEPYSNLVISGDHGIRMTRPGQMAQMGAEVYRLYPYTIKRGLKRVKTGTVVEYHHLKLEHPDDFFIANGLLIEGLRNIARS